MRTSRHYSGGEARRGGLFLSCTSAEAAACMSVFSPCRPYNDDIVLWMTDVQYAWYSKQYLFCLEESRGQWSALQRAHVCVKRPPTALGISFLFLMLCIMTGVVQADEHEKQAALAPSLIIRHLKSLGDRSRRFSSESTYCLSRTLLSVSFQCYPWARQNTLVSLSQQTAGRSRCPTPGRAGCEPFSQVSRKRGQ